MQLPVALGWRVSSPTTGVCRNAHGGGHHVLLYGLGSRKDLCRSCRGYGALQLQRPAHQRRGGLPPSAAGRGGGDQLGGREGSGGPPPPPNGLPQIPDLGAIWKTIFEPALQQASTAAGAAAAGTAATLAAPPAARTPTVTYVYPEAPEPEPAIIYTRPYAPTAPEPPPAALAAAPYEQAQQAAIDVAASSATSAALDAGAPAAAITAAAATTNDPVAAARQLQAFLQQYRQQYGSTTDARIDAATAKLQEYIDSYGPSDGSEAIVPQYRNYIMDSLMGTLDWINNLLIVNGTPKPYVYDAYGRVVADAGSAADAARQQEQLRAAAQSLRVLIGQLQEASSTYLSNRVVDSSERAAVGQVMQQLTTMADRLAVAAARRPTPGGAQPYVPPEHAYGADKYQDPLLRILDGIYTAVVVDSGLRDFLVGIKQLGDNLASSMEQAWSGAPPISRLIAYIAAIAGVLFLMRSRVPALTAPRDAVGRPRLPAPAAPAQPPAAAAAGGSGAAAGVVVVEQWEVFGQQAASGGGNGSSRGAAGSSGSVGAGGLPAPPPGGWNASHSDRVDWWRLSTGGGRSAPPSTSATGDGDAAARRGGNGRGAPSSSTGSGGNGLPRGVYAGVASNGNGAGVGSSSGSGDGVQRRKPVQESWEAFRRSNQQQQQLSGMQGAGSSSSSGGGSGGSSKGSFMDAAAAVAAAAVAAAAMGSQDPKALELQRAAEESRLEQDRRRMRAEIKERLRFATLGLRPIRSVVPGGEALRDEVDVLLGQLEGLSPTDKPLNTAVDAKGYATLRAPPPAVDPLMLGEWRLVYASNAATSGSDPTASLQPPSPANSPNLLASILQLADSLPGFGMDHVMQRVTAPAPNDPRVTSSGRAVGGGGFGSSQAAGRGGGGLLLTENSAVFHFGPLGSWRVCVRGTLADNGGGMCAVSEFESFGVRPVDLWGLKVEQLLPEVVVPIPEGLRSRSEWCTTYLDSEMRIGRGGPGGGVFLFKKEAWVSPAIAAAAGQPGGLVSGAGGPARGGGGAPTQRGQGQGGTPPPPSLRGGSAIGSVAMRPL